MNHNTELSIEFIFNLMLLWLKQIQYTQQSYNLTKRVFQIKLSIIIKLQISIHCNQDKKVKVYLTSTYMVISGKIKN